MMTKDFTEYLHFLKRFPEIGTMIYTKPILLTPVLGIIALNNQLLAIFLLLFFVAVDYSTGVLGSWYEAKKENKKGWYTSDKWRGSIMKSISYSLFILLSYGMEKVFFIKKFHFESYTDVDFTLTLVATAICISIEFYSIFWENLPKAGVNIPEKINAFVSKVTSFISALKNTNS